MMLNFKNGDLDQLRSKVSQSLDQLGSKGIIELISSSRYSGDASSD